MNAALSKILAVAAAVFDVKPSEILGKSRLKTITEARFAISYVARKTTRLSWPQIGIAYGNVDHTTIMSRSERCQELMKADKQFRTMVEEIERCAITD